jgi:hypothetical protein
MSKLTEKQEKSFVRSIARIVHGYKKKENVECIYLLPYETKQGNIFDLVIVFSEFDKKSLTNIRKYNKEHEKPEIQEKCGGLITIVSDSELFYSGIAMERREIIRVKDLLSSHILYDKTGRYHKIAHQFDRYNTMEKYTNIVDIKLTNKNKVKTKTKKED